MLKSGAVVSHSLYLHSIRDRNENREKGQRETEPEGDVVGEERRGKTKPYIVTLFTSPIGIMGFTKMC